MIIMKKNSLIVVVVSLAVLLAATCSLAEGMGMSRDQDLDDLWAHATDGHDLSREDAVILLESRHVVQDTAGTVTTRVHRVVWIGTSIGIRSYADLRIPWNTTTSELEVEILRTWRDGRWWPDPEAISETAVVHTLPHALSRADDYTTMRETMLLHDGVELPCIMETAYTITESGLPGADGLFLMPRRDRSVLTELKVTVPAETLLRYEMLNGVAEPVVTDDQDTTTMVWRMVDTPALQTPLSGAPAAYEPAVIWSTWPDWTSLRDHWREVFDTAAVLDEALADSVQSWIEPAPSPWSRIQAVADHVNKNVRGIHYSPEFWTFAPRGAVRTWETAYGHPLDRAVLTAALLRAAGYEVTPIFVGSGHSLVGAEVPRMAGLGDLHLSIKGDPAGLYDPDAGSLAGQAPLIGRPLWRTDQYVEPFLGQSQWLNRLEVTVTLEPGEEDIWQGSGHFYAAGVFCPQGVMAGMENGADEYLSGVLETMIPGLKLNRANPEVFHQHQVVFGLGLDMEMPVAEDSRPTRLVVGAPGHGLLSRLEGVPLYQEVRKSPVLLAGPMEQSVKIRLKADPEDVARLPDPVSVVNEAGEFTITTTSQDGWITVTRELKLTAGRYTVEQWPQLRALLLEENNAAGGTILFPSPE